MMRRRLIQLLGWEALFIPPALAKAAIPNPPTDEAGLNSFAKHYNRYVEQLRGGIIDLKEWGRVVENWKRL